MLLLTHPPAVKDHIHTDLKQILETWKQKRTYRHTSNLYTYKMKLRLRWKLGQVLSGSQWKIEIKPRFQTPGQRYSPTRAYMSVDLGYTLIFLFRIKFNNAGSEQNVTWFGVGKSKRKENTENERTRMSSRLLSPSPEIMPLKSGSSLGMAHSAILADVSDMERDILQMLHVNSLI